MKDLLTFATVLLSSGLFTYGAHGQTLKNDFGLVNQINHTNEAEFVANGCQYLTYYKLTHDRFIAAPLAYASKYGEVVGAVRMIDYRCAGGINVNNVTQYETTKESNATTEAMGIQDVIASHSMNEIKLDKRFIFGWAAVSALWAGISFASKLFAAACIVTSTFFPGTKTNTGVCVAGAVTGGLDLATGLINHLRTAGTAVGTITGNSYQSYSVYTQGAGSEAWALANVKRDLNDPFHDWLWAHSGLGHAHGHNYTNREILMANETHPVIWHHPISGSEGATWVVPHPFNETRNIVTVKPTFRQAVKNENMKNQKRDTCIGEDNGEYTICHPSNAAPIEPSLIVGLDMYGTSTQEWDVETQVGGEGSVNNGEGLYMDSAVEYTINHQSWDNCICYQDNGQWVGTGSLQFTWDGVYNGYSACWAADCAGASSQPY